MTQSKSTHRVQDSAKVNAKITKFSDCDPDQSQNLMVSKLDQDPSDFFP